MILYIVRHGKAEEQAFSSRDEDRSLTPKGIQQAQFLAECMAKAPVRPSLVISSGFIRAMTTARVLHTATACRFEMSKSLEIGHEVSEVIKLIEQAVVKEGARSKTETCIVVVGHNPQLSELCTTLTAGLHGDEILLRTGEAVVLGFRTADLIGAGKVLRKIRLDDAVTLTR
jgi:phosphohistidine phosphatase SixA